MQALRCRALTAGKSICAVRRERKRSVSLQKPPEASFQGCQEFIGLISVGGAATEESTAADAAGQAPGKTVAIAKRSVLSIGREDYGCGEVKDYVENVDVWMLRRRTVLFILSFFLIIIRNNIFSLLICYSRC